MRAARKVTIGMELHVPRKDAPKRARMSPPGPKGDASQQDQTHGQLGGEYHGKGHWDVDMKRNEAVAEKGDKGTRRAHEDSTVSAEHSKQDNYTAALREEEENNNLDAGDKSSCMKGSINTLLEKYPHNLSRPERSMLYEEGVRLQSEGQLENALKCLIGAITGLTESTTFYELPQCLHSVGDIYCEKDEYEKAVYFIQAEKMYYETALIDITSQSIPCVRDTQSEKGQCTDKEEAMEESFDQQPVESKRDGFDDDPSSNAKKGQEFENLAKFCLKEGKLQLALEYCGKATKVYQSVYGEDHQATVAARDLFTIVYADVGKKLYTDALQNYEEEEKDEVNAQKASNEVTNPSHSHPELRNRLHNTEMTHSQSEHTTHEGELEPTSLEEQDDWVMTCLLMIILFLVTIFIVIIISSIYCYNNSRSAYCAQTRGDINYWYMYARHMIHDLGKRFTWLD